MELGGIVLLTDTVVRFVASIHLNLFIYPCFRFII